ncbi:MAG: thermonuclease family protein [Planctomycetota bacterium]
MMRYAMSRRRHNIIAAVLLLAAVTLSALDYSCTSRTLNSPATPAVSQKSADLQKYDGKQFTVAKVVDGDTLDIDIPDGNYPHTRIRLWGVDTPETKDPRMGVMYYGPEASAFATKVALGKRVTIHLEKQKNSRGKYGRLLAYVQLPDKTYLNERLLSEGYAYADTRFKHGLYNKYKQLELLARSQKKGLWAEVTPEQMPEWRQRREASNAEKGIQN